MTPVFCCGFECGQLGTSGQHFASAAYLSISTTTVRTGARSLRVNPSATTTNILDNFYTAGQTAVVVRFYVYFSSFPSITSTLVQVFNQIGVTSGAVIYNASDNKIYAGLSDVGTGTDGVAVTTGRWYRIDFYADNTRTTKVSVDGVACSDVTATSATSIDTLRWFYKTSSYNADYFIDDVIYSYTAADYPIGAGSVQHFVPTSDGTHTCVSTNIREGTIAAPTAGAAITSATTDAFNWVDGVPLLGGASDNTRLINQVANDTGYVEVIFGPAPGISTPTNAPRAVEVITADRQASTTTGNFITRLNDNGTTSDIANRGTVAGVTSDRYVRKHFATPPTGGAWTIVSGAGNFNNIRARFGYSSDANPDQYWRGIMIEAEFLEITTTGLLPFCIAPQPTR